MSAPHSNGRTAILELLGSRPVAYYPALASIGGGVTAGVFLAQLFYWHDKGADPEGWIYKTQTEWKAETGLTRTEQETARRRLRERGILEEKLAGLPARLYYRLDADRVLELLAAQPSADGSPRRGRRETLDQDCSIAADKDAETLQSSMSKSCNQGCGNPADKFAGTLQTSVRETRKHAETTREHSREQGAERTSAAGSGEFLCSLHGQPMKLRHKDGDTWYSHRLPDGSWCKGAPGDQPDDRVDVQSWAYRRRYATQFGWDPSHFAPSDGEPDHEEGPGGPQAHHDAPQTPERPPPSSRA